MKKIKFSLLIFLFLETFIFSFSNLYSIEKDEIRDDISGTSLSDIDASEFLNWKNLSDDCASLFSSSNEVLNFKKGNHEFKFNTQVSSLLYEDGGVGLGYVRKDKPAPSFSINKIAEINNSILGNVELIYIGRQHFVNTRKYYNDNGHVNILPRAGSPVVSISEGFFVLIRQNRKSMDWKFYRALFDKNYMIASESLDSDEVFIIGDLRNFIVKRNYLSSSNSSSDMSSYIPKLSSTESRRNNKIISSLNSSEDDFLRVQDGSIIKTPRGGTIYRFSGSRIAAFPKRGAIVTGIAAKFNNFSSHAAILRRQRALLNDNSMIVEDPYVAIEESFKQTQAIVDLHFKNNPSLDRQEFERARLNLLLNSSVPEAWNPSDDELKLKIWSLSPDCFVEPLYPDIFRKYDIGREVLRSSFRDENGMYVRKKIFPFIMIKRGAQIYETHVLSDNVIHMQYLYFRFMNLAKYLDKNAFVVGGTLEVNYNMETGKAEEVKLINDGIYSLMRKEKLRMNSYEKQYLFSLIESSKRDSNDRIQIKDLTEVKN